MIIYRCKAFQECLYMFVVKIILSYTCAVTVKHEDALTIGFITVDRI